MPRFLRWPPTPPHPRRSRPGFQADSGIPGVVGTIYTTHSPIIAPKVSVAACFNPAATRSATRQGVVGPDEKVAELPPRRRQRLHAAQGPLGVPAEAHRGCRTSTRGSSRASAAACSGAGSSELPDGRQLEHGRAAGTDGLRSGCC
ncbi:unnamed protein product [Urochloa humidicola]